MVRGDQFPMTTKSTKFRWGDDDTDYVLNEVRAAINGEVYHDELHPFQHTENARASISVAIRHFIKCVNFNLMFEDAMLLVGISKVTQQFGLMPDLVQQITNIQGRQIPSNTLELLEKNFNLVLKSRQILTNENYFACAGKGNR